ncbi:Stage III sporulation protein AC/AD protein family protein [Ruminococcus flavefaciens]|uniref:Stage III sporulation protein AC/AD protein family protein n=1 Tax=Ruminococcus flavefaciens TaxID=1265 RepID=A0A1K1LPN5_RUMFL|nr:Stage III sporulation protein AC/AD protein family protein [Ruminococcus flavefaciens]
MGAFCLVGALISVILKQYCSEHSMAVSIAVCVGVMTFFVLLFDDAIDEIRDIFEMAGIAESYISIIFKTLAICCITHITAELCRDSGEGAIASAAELWGRGAVLVLGLPVFKSFLQLIDKLI